MIDNVPNQVIVTILNNDSELYSSILILILIMMTYCISYRKLLLSVIDPMLMMVFFSAWSAFFPIYFYINNMMYTEEYILQFVFTEILLCLGIYIGSMKNAFESNVHINILDDVIDYDLLFRTILYIYSSALIMYIVCADELPIMVYISGMGSRIAANQHNIMAYISQTIFRVLILPLTIIGFRLFLSKKKIITNKILTSTMLLVIIGMVLSGSKSAILLVLFYVFFALKYKEKDIDYLKKVKVKRILIIIAFLAILLPLFLYSLNGVDYIAFGMIYRLISSGNIFYLYAYDFFQWIDVEECFVMYLLNPTLATMHIISWSDIPLNIGYQAELLHHPYADLGGPNSRHNIVGYLYFGFYGSMVFSLACGYVIGWSRRMFIEASCVNNIFLYVIYASVYMNMMGVPTGIDSVPLSILSMLVIYSFTYIIYILMRKI